MAYLKTTNVVHVREDLSDLIENITPKETPLYTMIEKTKIGNEKPTWLVEETGAPDKNNAAAQGATFVDKANIIPQKRSNPTQIFTETAQVSRTMQSVNTAGSKNELNRQKALKTAKIKTDIEAAIVGNNGSDDGSSTGIGKLAGMESWIQTNVSHGTGGSTPGFSNGVISAPVNGTTRVVTEDLLINVLATAHDNGATGINSMFVPTKLKLAMANFQGNASRQIDGGDKKVVRGIKTYDGDFHLIDVIPHRMVTASTIMAFDPDKWALGVVDGLQTEPLAKDADGDRLALVTEVTLICRNEKANAKLADLKAA